MFPTELLGAAVLKAWRAVLPSDTQLVPVGGLTPEKLAGFVSAGASGAGLGAALYAPGVRRRGRHARVGLHRLLACCVRLARRGLTCTRRFAATTMHGAPMARYGSSWIRMSLGGERADLGEASAQVTSPCEPRLRTISHSYLVAWSRFIPAGPCSSRIFWRQSPPDVARGLADRDLLQGAARPGYAGERQRIQYAPGVAQAVAHLDRSPS